MLVGDDGVWHTSRVPRLGRQVLIVKADAQEIWKLLIRTEVKQNSCLPVVGANDEF